MKITTSFLAALLLTGTALWARVVTQGMIPALVSTAIEGGLNRQRTRRR